MSPVQSRALFDSLKTRLCLTELEIDDNFTLVNIHEDDFTTVINNLDVVKFIGTNISNKQLTSLLTTILNHGNFQL